MKKELVVKATWDEEAQVWVAESDDVPGLVTEAPTAEALVEKLKVLIPELLDANGCGSGEDVPFKLLSEFSATIHRRAA